MVKPWPPLPPPGDRAATLSRVLRHSGEAATWLGAFFVWAAEAHESEAQGGVYAVLAGFVVTTAGFLLGVWDDVRRERAGRRGRRGHDGR